MFSNRITREASTPRRFLRRLLPVAASLALACLAAFDASPAFAQKGKDDPVEKVEHSYTMPYFFSGAAVLMVVVPLCLPMLRPVDVPKDEDD